MIDERIWVSWNSNIKHPHKEIFFPRSEEEIVHIIKGNRSKIRVFGERKSSADIAAGTENLISLTHYDNILNVDHNKKQIEVQSGILLKKLLNTLEELKWTIPCLPDIDEISLGGALATGTHGTGREGHLLSEYIVSMRLITATGHMLELEDEEQLNAYRLSIGLLGITSTVTIQCVDLYTLSIKERPVKDNIWISQYKKLLWEHNFTRVLWLPHTNYAYVITGDIQVPGDPEIIDKHPWWHKYRRSTSAFLYKITLLNPKWTVLANKIIQKLFFNSSVEYSGTLYGATVTKSRGSTLELSEWTVSLEYFEELIQDLKIALNSKKNKAYAHIPMDIRFIKADKTWLSYAYNQDTVTIGCVTRHAASADTYYAFELIEKVFLKYGGRPHFAKRFKAGKSELNKLYPKWDDFIALRQKLDPKGRFLNSYLEKIYL